MWSITKLMLRSSQMLHPGPAGLPVSAPGATKVTGGVQSLWELWFANRGSLGNCRGVSTIAIESIKTYHSEGRIIFEISKRNVEVTLFTNDETGRTVCISKETCDQCMMLYFDEHGRASANPTHTMTKLHDPASEEM